MATTRTGRLSNGRILHDQRDSIVGTLLKLYKG
jgi:hypothetical protein